MMDDNLWEACEALVKKGEKAAEGRYLELCPKGSYVKKAQKSAQLSPAPTTKKRVCGIGG